jgi:hypothetical protein
MFALDARVEIENDKGDVFSAYSNILNEIPALDVKKTKIRDKFHDLAKPVLGKEKTVSLSEAVYNLDKIKDIRELINLI